MSPAAPEAFPLCSVIRNEVISMATNKRVGSAKQAADASRAKRPDAPSPSRSDKGTLGRLAAAKVGAALDQVDELLCQALETELGGVQVYRTALRCAQDAGLRAEWQSYLDQTERHVRRMHDVFQRRALAPETETLGRQSVRPQATGVVA